MVDEMLKNLMRQAVAEALEAERPRIVEEVAAKLGAATRTDEYLTTAQAAKILRVHPDTLRAMVADGKLPRREVAGHLRFTRSDIKKTMGAADVGSETADEIVERMVKSA